jgi:hypothetical protein
MKPAVRDMYIVRGSTDPKVWRFKDSDGNGIIFDDLRFTCNKGNKLLFRVSITGDGDAPAQIEMTDYVTGEYTFTPTAEQTRLVPKGTVAEGTVKARFEIEGRQGTLEQVWLMGAVDGIGGDNDDESVSP